MKNTLGWVAVVAGVLTFIGSAAATPASDRQHIDASGGALSIGERIHLLVPAGLPVGQRTYTLAVSRRRPRARDVGSGFLPVGPALQFDGAIDATASPLQLRMRLRRIPRRAGHGYAVAVEHLDMCEGQQRIRSDRLCTSWTILRAQRRGRDLRAAIPVTGGRRIQFGLAPRRVLANLDGES